MSRELHELGDTAGITSQKKRTATVYDAVAGRVGTNGFLTNHEKSTSAKALTPDEVLRRKTPLTALDFAQEYESTYNIHGADTELPDSDLLKAIHAYASDFYSHATNDHGVHDYASLDGTALIAIGCLLQETMHNILGENGDMALVEPRSFGNGLPEHSVTAHRIHGKVRPPPTPPPLEDTDSDSDDQPAKKRRK